MTTNFPFTADEEASPKSFTAIVVVTKDGVGADKLSEILADQPPVISGMYVHKYVTAQLGRRLRITIEKAPE